MRVAANPAEGAISPVAEANGFEVLGDQTIFDLFGAVLVAFALMFWTDEAPPSFQSTLLLDQYFCKRRNFIFSKDFATIICVQLMVITAVILINPSEDDCLVIFCYIISIAFMIGLMLCAFYSVRKILKSRRWLLLAPLRFLPLRMHFSASIFIFPIYRPPCLI